MALDFPPKAGQIIICDYEGFKVPEMVKKRPVIVISPKPRRATKLCAIVPLSTTAPQDIARHHIKILMPKEIVDATRFSHECWAKCDIVNTVSLQRLHLIKLGKQGKRIYSYYTVDEETLHNVRMAVLHTITGST